jgi:DNA polymerase/3'-5' exonuclease PolX
MPRTYQTTDIFITHPSFSMKRENTTFVKRYFTQILEQLKLDGTIVDTFWEDEFVCIALVKTPSERPDESSPLRRVAIEYVPIEKYWSTVIYHTGNKYFWTWITTQAKENGYLLTKDGFYLMKNDGKKFNYLIKNYSNHYLKAVGPAITVLSEEEIFEHIGLPYTKPERRNYMSQKQLENYQKMKNRIE